MLKKLGNGGRWADAFPQLCEVEIDPADMWSEEKFLDEQEHVFRKAWLYAAHVHDFEQAGSYVVREFPGLKASLLLVRGADGNIRAFHNVCRHRCNKLEANSCGLKKSFACEYHGWVYDLSGKLAGLPDSQQFSDFRRDDLGLVPVHVEIWKGFVFVNFSKQPHQTLKEFLGPVAEYEIANFPFENAAQSWTWQADVRCNWKVGLDLFSEGYHVQMVHQRSVRRLYTDKENPYNHLPVINLLGLHRMTSIYASARHEPVGVGLAALKYGGGGLSRLRNTETIKAARPGVNPDAIENWGFDVYTLFPNLQISIFGAFWHFHYFQPITATTMRWEHRIFFPKPENVGERFAQEYMRSIQEVVATEDLSVAESNQRGLELCGFMTPALGDEEVILRHTRKAINDFRSQSVLR